MAYTKDTAIKKYWGSSTDTKPTVSAGSPVPVGSEFNETDTRDKYIFTGSSWVKYVRNYRSRTPAEERR